jgi:hypothetical protein
MLRRAVVAVLTNKWRFTRFGFLKDRIEDWPQGDGLRTTLLACGQLFWLAFGYSCDDCYQERL